MHVWTAALALVSEFNDVTSYGGRLLILIV